MSGEGAAQRRVLLRFAVSVCGQPLPTPTHHTPLPLPSLALCPRPFFPRQEEKEEELEVDEELMLAALSQAALPAPCFSWS